jgi:hypothetical protein
MNKIMNKIMHKDRYSKCKIIIMLAIVMLCSSAANINAKKNSNASAKFDPLSLVANNIDKNLVKVVDKPKLGIASTQTIFGAMAVAEQAKRIELIKLEEGCQFDKPRIKVEYKEPVNFVIRNDNLYAARLTFTSIDNPVEYYEKYSDMPAAAVVKTTSAYGVKIGSPVKKAGYILNIPANGRVSLDWFFNRKKIIKWVCFNKDNKDIGIAEIQVGNAKKTSANKEKVVTNDGVKYMSKKQAEKYNKPLPPPPLGF